MFKVVACYNFVIRNYIINIYSIAKYERKEFSKYNNYFCTYICRYIFIYRDIKFKNILIIIKNCNKVVRLKLIKKY